MKTNITFFVIILMVIAELTVAAVYIPEQVSQTVVFETTSESRLVRAEIIDGELMPVVDLPTVEITSTTKPIVYLPVKIVGDGMMAFINLPEIEIIGENVNTNTNNDIPVATVDLPQIDIVSTSMRSKMVRVQSVDQSNFTLIADLPEVTIYGYEVSNNIQPPLLIGDYVKFNTNEESRTYMIASKKFELNGFFKINDDCTEYLPVNVTVKKKQNGVMILVANNRYFVPGTLHNENIKVEQHIN